MHGVQSALKSTCLSPHHPQEKQIVPQGLLRWALAVNPEMNWVLPPFLATPKTGLNWVGCCLGECVDTHLLFSPLGSAITKPVVKKNYCRGEPASCLMCLCFYSMLFWGEINWKRKWREQKDYSCFYWPVGFDAVGARRVSVQCFNG